MNGAKEMPYNSENKPERLSWEMPGVLFLSVPVSLPSLSCVCTHLWIILPPRFGVFQLRPRSSGEEKKVILVLNPISQPADSMILINGSFIPLSLGVICFTVKLP